MVVFSRPLENVKYDNFTSSSNKNGKDKYKKASCTCKAVVLHCKFLVPFRAPHYGKLLIVS